MAKTKLQIQSEKAFKDLTKEENRPWAKQGVSLKMQIIIGKHISHKIDIYSAIYQIEDIFEEWYMKVTKK